MMKLLEILEVAPWLGQFDNIFIFNNEEDGLYDLNDAEIGDVMEVEEQPGRPQA